MPSASNDIRAAIDAANGSIPFREFMSIALYGTDGFYTSGGHAGRRGDFITSPEVGPLFGAVLARMIDAEWRRQGEPSLFTVVDAGAGPGTLCRGILSAEPACSRAMQLIAVESSAAQREMHPVGIVSMDRMPDHIEHGVIIANELLDNLPFGLWVHDGGWREAHVVSQGDGFGEVLRPGTPGFPLREGAPHGARAPVQGNAQEWLRTALGSLSHGTVLVIDYCTARTVEAAAVPWREWLRTYAGHERGAHYLKDPGSQDITAQVMIDQLAAVSEPDAVRTQAQFLQLWGIEELVAEGARIWRENAAAPTLAAMKMRSRISESEALLDPTGLGGFSVIEWRV